MTRGEQAIFNLEIKKKGRSSSDTNINNSIVPSSGFINPFSNPRIRHNYSQGPSNNMLAIHPRWIK